MELLYKRTFNFFFYKQRTFICMYTSTHKQQISDLHQVSPLVKQQASKSASLWWGLNIPGVCRPFWSLEFSFNVTIFTLIFTRKISSDFFFTVDKPPNSRSSKRLMFDNKPYFHLLNALRLMPSIFSLTKFRALYFIFSLTFLFKRNIDIYIYI